MFCPQCGNQNADGSPFCSMCGADFDVKPAKGIHIGGGQQQFFPGQPAAGGAGAKVKMSKLPIILISAALIVIAAVIVVVMMFNRPGSKIMKAIEKTYKADSLEIVLEAGNDKLDIKAKGKNDDFTLFISEESKHSDYKHYIFYEDGEVEDDGEFYEDEDIVEIYEAIGTRDPIKVVESNDDILELFEEDIIENYEKALPTVEKLLNDTKADYIESYKKKGDSYTYEIDLVKLYYAGEEEGLEYGGEFEELIEDIEDDGIDVFLRFTIKLKKGYVDEVKIKLTFEARNDRDTETMTVKFKEINSLDDKDFDFDPKDYYDRTRDYDY